MNSQPPQQNKNACSQLPGNGPTEPGPTCRVVDSNTGIPEFGSKLKACACSTARQMSIHRGKSLEPASNERAAHHELTAVIEGSIKLGLNSKQVQDQFGCYGLARMERYLKEREGTPYARSHNISEEDIQTYIDGLTFYRPPAVGSALTGAAEEAQFTELISGSFVCVTMSRGDQTSTHSLSDAGKQM